MYKLTSQTAEAPVCLWDQGIYDNNDNAERVRRSHRLSNKNAGVGRGREIDGASEGLETTTDALRIQGL